MPDALATLTDACEARSLRQGGTTDHARPVVISWPTVPIEIVRAAGLRPLPIRSRDVSTPLADAWIESDVYPNRLRQLVEAFLAGELQDAASIVLPRTSDPDYKAFLYLRELVRRRLAPRHQPILLFDLLQSNGPDVRSYDAARTRDLFAVLTELAGQTRAEEDVRAAIADANLARSALRRLLGLRGGTPRVRGAEVLPLLGAFWHLPARHYAALANEAADALSRRTPLEGPRVLLAGAPVDGPALHADIESLGGLVVAETGPWGSDAAGEDVAEDGDPFMAIAERYRRNAIGPRMPVAAVQQRVRWMANDVDAVVVVLPPEDTVFGWGYPALRDWLEARHLPHVCLTSDPCQPLGPADRERLVAMLAALTPRVEARHG